MLHFLLTFPVILCTACDARDGAPAVNAGNDACRIVGQPVRLPDAVHETSGLALSRRDAQTLWTHNDRGNEPYLYALSADGALLGNVAVTGVDAVDWEDIEAGPCGSGMCLYIADIGDNEAARHGITIHVVTEPATPDQASVAARALHARYPDGPHNAESMFMLPGGDLYIVTKGEDGPAGLYRLASADRATEPVVLERVRAALTRPQDRSGRVTGAAATPDGRHVAIRTYASLHIYSTAALVAGAETSPIAFDLRPLRETQGEGVAIADDGSVWLSSEAERGGQPQLARLSCTLPQ